MRKPGTRDPILATDDSKPVKIGVRMVNVKAKRKARAHAKRVKAQKRHMAA